MKPETIPTTPRDCRKTATPIGLVVFLAVLLAGALPAWTQSAGLPAGVRSFIVVSDLHYNGSTNPSVLPALSRMGQDCNLGLIQSALADAHRRCPDPLFVLCLGDVLAHANLRPGDFNPRKEQAAVARIFRAEFPDTPVFAVLGNNDSDEDHDLQSADFLAAWSESWSPLLKDGPAVDNFKQGFPAHGYFAADIPGTTDLRLVVLNSSSFDRRCANPRAGAEAKAQLDWLAGEIDRAGREKKRLWLAFHMPPGDDAFYPDGTTAYWSAAAQSNFLAAILPHADVVAAIFCGHTHRDEFRIIRNGATPAAFIHITPALSPCYLNNPGYQICDVQTNSGRMLDCRTFYLPLLANGPAWALEYSFVTAFGQPAYDLPSLVAVQAELRWGEKADLFREFYGVSNPAGQIPALNNFGAYLDKTTIPTIPPGP